MFLDFFPSLISFSSLRRSNCSPVMFLSLTYVPCFVLRSSIVTVERWRGSDCVVIYPVVSNQSLRCEPGGSSLERSLTALPSGTLATSIVMCFRETKSPGTVI